MTPRRLIRTYMVLSAMYVLAASLIWSVTTLFLLDAGLSISEVFVANAAFSAGMVIFEIPTGVVADTLGRRVSYLLSVAVLCFTTLLYLWAALAGVGVVAFALVSILMGLGFTFYSGALEAWLVDGLTYLGAADRLDNLFARAQQVNGVAMFLGTIAGGFLGQIDLALPFIIRSGLLVGVFAIAWVTMRDLGFEPRPFRLDDLPRAMVDNAIVGVNFGWRQPGLRLLMSAAAVRGVFFGWAFYAAQPFFLELLDRDAVWVVGLITAGMSLATIAGNQVVHLLSRACQRRSTLLIGAAAVSTAAAVVMGLTSSFSVALGAFFVVGMAMGVTTPVRQAYLHALTTSEHRATVVSFDAMVGSLGGVGGQIGLGAVSDARSLSSGYVAGGLVTALALPILWSVRTLGGPADRIAPSAVVTACPQGLPRLTQIDDAAAAPATAP